MISGHVATYPFDDLVRYAEFHRHLEAHVLAGLDAGMTVEEIVGAYSQPADLEDFSFIEPFATNFVQLLYDEAGADRTAADATQRSPLPHAVRTTKFTIEDVDQSTAFYLDFLGMTEVGRFVDEGRLVEPFMGFGEGGGRVGLLGYTEWEGLPKSQYPVSVLSVPDLDPIVTRLDAAAYPIFEMSAEETGSVRLVIVRDPSGNAIEIVETPGPAAVGGARLVVDDRQAGEDFFVQIFGVSPGQRIVTDTFDEVFMEFGDGMFVALIEPQDEAPLPKSRNPVVAIYSTQFDAVLARVKAGGHSVREFGTNMFMVDDPRQRRRGRSPARS